MISLTSIWLGRDGRVKTREVIVNPMHVVAAHETTLHPTGEEPRVVTTIRMTVGPRIVVRESLAHVHGLGLHMLRHQS
jgi:hypothetical protein